MTLDEFEQARANRKRASERVAALLQKAPRIIHAYGMDGLRARGIRMENCGSFYAGDVCPVCHTFHPTAGSRCRDRLCPNCGWVLAIERSTAARRAIESLGNRYAIFHVVLTMRDPVAADGAMLHDQCRHLVDAYAKLVHNNKFKSMVWGTIRCLEISNNGASRYHPHIHALFVRKLQTPPMGRMMNHEELCTMWQKALEVDYRPVTWIERIYYIDEAADGSKITLYDPAETESETASKAVIDKAVLEACKYAIKPSLYETADMNMLVELAEGIRGIHMFECSGGMRAAYRKAAKEIEEERETPQGKCPACGARADRVVLNWQNGGYTI